MGKGKSPRKRKDPIDQSADDEQQIERQTEQAELLPAPFEPREPPRPVPERQSSPVPERAGPSFSEFVQALRRAAGAVLDIADAAAEAIRNRIEGRA